MVAKIERDVIARGVFASVKDLSQKLLRYILNYNNSHKSLLQNSQWSMTFWWQT